jgi:hypothetical protein
MLAEVSEEYFASKFSAEKQSKQDISIKQDVAFDELHGVMFQTTKHLTTTAVRTSNAKKGLLDKLIA